MQPLLLAVFLFSLILSVCLSDHTSEAPIINLFLQALKQTVLILSLSERIDFARNSILICVKGYKTR